MTVIAKYFVRKNSINYSLVSFNFERDHNASVDQTPFETSKATGDILSIGDDVSIGYMDGAAFVEDFSGDIVEKRVNETGVFVLESYGGRLNRAEHFSAIYNNRSPEFIAEDIINTQVSSLTFASSSASGILIEEFVIRDETPAEAMGRLVELLVWQIRTDNSKNFYFEPSGNTINPTQLILDSNAFLQDEWNFIPNSIINFVTFKGGGAVFSTSQTFVATASQTVFTVDNKISGSVKVTDDGVEVVGGVEGSTTSFDYGISADNNDVIFEVGRTVGHSIVVNYDYEIPIKITGSNNGSISSNGIFSRKITEKNVVTMGDARRRIKQILSLYSELSRNGLLLVGYDSSHTTGETVTVVDVFNDVNLPLLISKMSLSYPSGDKFLYVGTPKINVFDWQKGIDGRLRRLESDQNNSSKIQQYRNFEESVDVSIKTGRLRVRTNSFGNSSIYGSSNNGKYGINTGTENGLQQLFGEHNRVETLASVTSLNDIMIENFSNVLYKDSGNTTATWNISLGLCSFASGEVAQSSVVYKNTVKTRAKFTVSDESNLSAELSMNGGSNWESVSFGVFHTFVNTGNSLLWRLTASGNASITFSKVEIQ